ncbi:hypothetical protein Misp01_67090 [Microtetraspora sp. NBRC 13810]|nr:hypothetical protein Misp01_67090 [Microtetraspora sp. NBRC 13810]
MWSRRPVQTCSYSLRELDHPVIGRVTLANETVTLPDDDQQIGLFYAGPGSSDTDALAVLAQSLERRLAPGSKSVSALATRISYPLWTPADE